MEAWCQQAGGFRKDAGPSRCEFFWWQDRNPEGCLRRDQCTFAHSLADLREPSTSLPNARTDYPRPLPLQSSSVVLCK